MGRREAIDLAVCVAAVGVVVLASAAWSSEAEGPLLHEDFETDPLPREWTSTTPTGADGNDWTSDEAYSGAYSVRVVDGAWRSPAIDSVPQTFYEIVHRALPYGDGLWGPSNKSTVPYDADGVWAEHRHAFRAERERVSLIFRPRTAGGDGTPIYVDDVRVRPISRGEAAAILDERAARMPSYTFSVPSPDRQTLRTTARKLAHGRPLRVVMLGDSIVDDTSHSYFEVLVERILPRAAIRVITSTRGSTGAWWYREIDGDTGIPRVWTWVTDHRPDLVMFGGISHGKDGLDHEIASIRDVIAQVRRRLPSTEFVLMSEIAGSNDPRERPDAARPFDPEGDGWRARLYRLAQEERVAFLDMTLPWARYILDTGIATDELMRDDVHMNARGSLVAGRILEAWFEHLGVTAPERPAPATRTRGRTSARRPER